jgi:hypothetical protein
MVLIFGDEEFSTSTRLSGGSAGRNMVLYGADKKAVILNIVQSELYRIIILPNNTIIIPSISLLPYLRF